ITFVKMLKLYGLHDWHEKGEIVPVFDDQQDVLDHFIQNRIAEVVKQVTGSNYYKYDELGLTIYGKVNSSDDVEWTDGDIIPLHEVDFDFVEPISEQEYLRGTKK